MTNASLLVRDSRFEPQRWIEPPQITLIPLSELWALLASGTIVLVDSQYSDQRCFATLQAPARGNRPQSAQLRVLERVLLGERQKSVAIDLGVSASTIAVACETSLSAMGEHRSASRAFVLFAMALHSYHGLRLEPARLAITENPSPECWTISVERPDCELPPCLTHVEKSVVRLMVEGRTHLEIAARRRVSPRTIANQLASIFRKLGASGRSELVSHLVRRSSRSA